MPSELPLRYGTNPRQSPRTAIPEQSWVIGELVKGEKKVTLG
jgi:hypothetical protein